MYILYFKHSACVYRQRIYTLSPRAAEMAISLPPHTIVVTVCLDFYDFFIGHHLKLQAGKFTTTVQLQRSRHRVCVQLRRQ